MIATEDEDEIEVKSHGILKKGKIAGCKIKAGRNGIFFTFKPSLSAAKQQIGNKE